MALATLFGLLGTGVAGAQVFQPTVSTSEELADAVDAVNAGVAPAQAMLEQPELHRETLAFKRDLYEGLTGEEYSNTSSIYRLSVQSGDELAVDEGAVIGGVTVSGSSFELLVDGIREADYGEDLTEGELQLLIDEGIYRIWGVVGVVYSDTYQQEIFGVVFEHDSFGVLVWELIPLGAMDGAPVQRGLEGTGAEGSGGTVPGGGFVGDYEECMDLALSNWIGCNDNAKTKRDGQIAKVGAGLAVSVIGCGVVAVIPVLGWGASVSCLVAAHTAAATLAVNAAIDYRTDLEICDNNRVTDYRNCCIMFPDDCIR